MNLWARFTLDIGEARRALEAEKAAHWRTLEAASMRVVSGAPQTAAIAARELALLAKIKAIEAEYAAQRNELKSTHMLVVAALHAQQEEQRRAFQALEAECFAAHAAKDSERRFVDEWARFAPKFETGMAGLGAKVRRRAVPGPDWQRGSAAVKRRFAHATAIGRVLTAAERSVASKRQTTSDPYLS